MIPVEYHIYIAQAYLMICILFLAGKDATSYRLKDHNRSAGSLQSNRIKRWHRDGVALWVLVTLPVAYFVSGWLLLYSVLIRGAVFDLGFNKWAGLQTTYLGGSAFWDKFFVKIFGQHGAVWKSIAFGVILIIINIFIPKL